MTPALPLAEISARKSNLIGGFKVDLATTGGLANTLLAAVNRGYGPAWLDEYPAKVQALSDEQVNAAIKEVPQAPVHGGGTCRQPACSQ